MRSSWIYSFLLVAQLAHANLPYYPISFPRDEAAHYKQVPYAYDRLSEWWYFNGKLSTDDGKHLSYDIAFFNPALNSKNVMTLPFVHIQVADLDNNKSYGVKKTYDSTLANVSTEQLDFSIGSEFSLRKTKLNSKEVYLLIANIKNGKDRIVLNLVLDPVSSPFLINENGLMPMPNNTNSYYYSIPHLDTTGFINVNGNNFRVSKSKGDSWHDHQWGDFTARTNGWEWMSVRLENGLIANIFLNIEYKTLKVVDGLASIILPNGEKRFIAYKDMEVSRDHYWYDNQRAVSYPMTFNFNFPSLGLSFTSTAAFAEQELHSYWEGYCVVDAVYNKLGVNGYAYTEIVYTQPVP